MNKFFTELSLNKKLAAVALFLAVAAVVIGDPMQSNNSNINLNELALEVENEKDHIDAVELADWVMQRKDDYTLIDIRDKKSYDEYHIPTAINSSLQKLVNEKYSPEKKIVIYSQGGTHGSQAWFFLKAMGYKEVYFLRYGLYEWIDEVLFPKILQHHFLIV